MCKTWTVHYVCGCDEAEKAPSNGCDGNCTGDNIKYEDSDVEMSEYCAECIAARSLGTPPTSSEDSSASEE
jgi:hypothetical protein